ncbi:MAG: hypothetical protein AAFN11_08180 [Chloroflexota bacterium]
MSGLVGAIQRQNVANEIDIARIRVIVLVSLGLTANVMFIYVCRIIFVSSQLDTKNIWRFASGYLILYIIIAILYHIPKIDITRKFLYLLINLMSEFIINQVMLFCHALFS